MNDFNLAKELSDKKYLIILKMKKLNASKMKLMKI